MQTPEIGCEDGRYWTFLDLNDGGGGGDDKEDDGKWNVRSVKQHNKKNTVGTHSKVNKRTICTL